MSYIHLQPILLVMTQLAPKIWKLSGGLHFLCHKQFGTELFLLFSACSVPYKQPNKKKIQHTNGLNSEKLPCFKRKA